MSETFRDEVVREFQELREGGTLQEWAVFKIARRHGRNQANIITIISRANLWTSREPLVWKIAGGIGIFAAAYIGAGMVDRSEKIEAKPVVEATASVPETLITNEDSGETEFTSFDDGLTKLQLQKLCFQVRNTPMEIISRMCSVRNDALQGLQYGDVFECTRRTMQAKSHCGEVPALN